MTVMTIAAPSKFPVFRTVGQAYALWLRNFSDLVRICGLWLLLMAPVIAIWNWKNWSDSVWGSVIWNLIWLPALASVAVAWHRLLLREEHPGPGVYLRLDKVVAGYALLAFLIELIFQAPFFVSAVLFQIKTGSSATLSGTAVAVAFLATVAGIVAIIFIVPRLSLALPGIALGRDDATLAGAWRVSQGNTWRMIWANLLCALPLTAIAILSIGIKWIAIGADGNRTVETMISTMTDLLMIPCGMISVGMLSLAYRYFSNTSR